MSYCENCQEEKSGVEYVTMAISYDLGPMKAALCLECREGEVVGIPAVTPMHVFKGIK